MSDSSGAAILSSLLGGLKKRWFIIAVIIAITCAHAYPSFGAKSGMAYRNWQCRTMDRIMVGRTIIFYQSGAQSVKKLLNHHYSSSLCYSLIL